MSTYCAIHIQTNQKSSVVSEVEKYLAASHPSRLVHTSIEESFGGLYGDEFICSSSEHPTKFAIISEQPEWITIHFNCLMSMQEMTSDLSRKLSALAVIVMAQSVSSAYCVEVIRGGELLRAIEFADGEWYRQDGSPLPFEVPPLGTNISEKGSEPFHVFETEATREYCEHLGLKLWRDDWMDLEHPEWTIVRV